MIDKGLAGEFKPLEVVKEIAHCIWILERNKIALNRKKPFMYEMFDLYHIDILLYKRLLNVLKQTKAKNVSYRFCGLRGLFWIKYDGGQFELILSTK